MTIVSIAGLVKDYRGLRPLRIERLAVARGEQVALLGVDAPAAEILVNLLTGSSLPDAGAIEVLGRSTAGIVDSADWLSLVDRFGIVTPRAVFLDPLSVVQNLAIPFSLEIEPPPPAIRARAEALAVEVGLTAGLLDRRLSELDPAARVRVALARALALDPEIVLMEHPTASVPVESVPTLAADLRGVLERRGVATLTLTADPAFAKAGARRVLHFEPASGRLSERRGWFR